MYYDGEYIQQHKCLADHRHLIEAGIFTAPDRLPPHVEGVHGVRDKERGDEREQQRHDLPDAVVTRCALSTGHTHMHAHIHTFTRTCVPAPSADSLSPKTVRALEIDPSVTLMLTHDRNVRSLAK